ncbi:MAG TPA: DUF542 domain-containing protein [Terracidiphilus sp.]|jgi:iron-sulfur cluster repair protein YtfE (RIC family)
MATETQAVREIALEQPTSIRVFETLGIDYCCGGSPPAHSSGKQPAVSLGNCDGGVGKVGLTDEEQVL